MPDSGRCCCLSRLLEDHPMNGCWRISSMRRAIFVMKLLLLLDDNLGIQRRIVNLVGHDLASSLEPLSLRGSEASLSLFYRYYNGRCSKGLSLVVPPNRTFGRTTRFSAHSYPHTVSVPKANTWRYSSSFFPCTAILWNSLPGTCILLPCHL